MISNLLTALNECFMPFATFRHAVGKVLPSVWQMFANVMAKLCQYVGKTRYPAPNEARLQVRFHKVNRT